MCFFVVADKKKAGCVFCCRLFTAGCRFVLVRVLVLVVVVVVVVVVMAESTPSTSTTAGSVAAFRAGVVDPSSFPHIDQDVDPVHQKPHFEGTCKDFLAAHGGNKTLTHQLKNTVKKCPGCGKANAYVHPR